MYHGLFQRFFYCKFATISDGVTEFQNCCLDNSNPNSVNGSTINQFETPVRGDIFTKRFFGHSFLLLIFFVFFCIFLLVTSLSQF